MDGIRSSLELAMERSAKIAIDSDKIQQQESRKKGKILANLFLNSDTTEQRDKLAAKLGNLGQQSDYRDQLQGLTAAIVTQLRLPVGGQTYSTETLLKLLDLILVDPAKTQAAELVREFESIGQQFLSYKERIYQQVKEQYQLQFRQKEKMIEQQTGHQISIDIETDPQAAEVLRRHYQQLESQFQPVLQQLRDRMTRLLQGGRVG